MQDWSDHEWWKSGVGLVERENSRPQKMAAHKFTRTNALELWTIGERGKNAKMDEEPE